MSFIICLLKKPRGEKEICFSQWILGYYGWITLVVESLCQLTQGRHGEKAIMREVYHAIYEGEMGPLKHK